MDEAPTEHPTRPARLQLYHPSTPSHGVDPDQPLVWLLCRDCPAALSLPRGDEHLLIARGTLIAEAVYLLWTKAHNADAWLCRSCTPE